MNTEISKMSTQNQLMPLVLQTMAFFLITLSQEIPLWCSMKGLPDVHNTDDHAHWWNKAKYSWIWYKHSGPVVNVWLIKVRLSSSFY